jgi:hypothetical protein
MEKELSKLLGAQFGLDIDTNDVYEFLIKKIYSFFDIGHIHGWGTQNECLAPKSLSRHHFV